MMAQHTPGPWTVDLWEIGTPWNVSTTGDDIALAIQIVGDDRKQSRRSANARLIAAAPDLLAALKALVARIEQDCDVLREGITGGAYAVAVNDYGANWVDEFNKAETAIAKAEGR